MQEQTPRGEMEDQELDPSQKTITTFFKVTSRKNSLRRPNRMMRTSHPRTAGTATADGHNLGHPFADANSENIRPEGNTLQHPVDPLQAVYDIPKLENPQSTEQPPEKQGGDLCSSKRCIRSVGSLNLNLAKASSRAHFWGLFCYLQGIGKLPSGAEQIRDRN